MDLQVEGKRGDRGEVTEGGVGSWGDVEGGERSWFWAIRRHDDAYPSRFCQAEIEAIEGGLGVLQGVGDGTHSLSK